MKQESGIIKNQRGTGGGHYKIKHVFQKCHSNGLFWFVSRSPFSLVTDFILERRKLAVKIIYDRSKKIKLFHIHFHTDQTVTSLKWIKDLFYKGLFPAWGKVRISVCINAHSSPAFVRGAAVHWGLVQAFGLAKRKFLVDLATDFTAHKKNPLVNMQNMHTKIFRKSSVPK